MVSVSGIYFSIIPVCYILSCQQAWTKPIEIDCQGNRKWDIISNSLSSRTTINYSRESDIWVVFSFSSKIDLHHAVSKFLWCCNTIASFWTTSLSYYTVVQNINLINLVSKSVETPGTSLKHHRQRPSLKSFRFHFMTLHLICLASPCLSVCPVVDPPIQRSISHLVPYADRRGINTNMNIVLLLGIILIFLCIPLDSAWSAEYQLYNLLPLPPRLGKKSMAISYTKRLHTYTSACRAYCCTSLSVF